MVEILEQPEIRRLVSPISVEIYQQLDEFKVNGRRTELIRGVLIEKMGKTPLHVALLYRLLALVQMAVDPTKMLVRKEDPLTLLDSEPEPDLAVVVGGVTDYRSHHPFTALLVAEISVTSLGLDRAKADLYAEADVPEYWIVRATDQIVDVYTAPVNGLYTQLRAYQIGETIVASALPALLVDLSALFAD